MAFAQRTDLAKVGFARLPRKSKEQSCLREKPCPAGWIDSPRYHVPRKLAASIAWNASGALCETGVSQRWPSRPLSRNAMLANDRLTGSCVVCSGSRSVFVITLPLKVSTVAHLQRTHLEMHLGDHVLICSRRSCASRIHCAIFSSFAATAAQPTAVACQR